ncbi:MAG: hypothetical protein IJB97_09325, partial [Clostridia bacterium]|nr:hypothetical protein [Clostridia bacterium]
MAKKNSMKRALLFGATSMALSVSMFVGTTFAWFTDTVTSNNNKIVAGNLDVELYYQNDEVSEWTKVGAETNVFKANTLWEPGHTEVVRLKVVNEGSLALKYQLGVNVASETTSTNVKNEELKLSNFIEYGLVDGNEAYATREAAIQAVESESTALNVAYNSGTTKLTVDDTATTDVKENEDFVTMVVYMPTTVGNDANAKKGAAVPTINLGINLYATQVEAEDDSFGGDYDKNAAYVSAPVERPDNATTDMYLKGASEVVMKLPAEVINALPADVEEIGMAVSDPVVEGDTVTFAEIDLVDQNGKGIDLEALTLTEDITVTLPLPANAFAADETVYIYHDGEYVAMATVNADGSISYAVDHFCEVVVSSMFEAAVDITNNAAKLGSAVILTADVPYGTLKATVPAGAQLSSIDVSSLKLTVETANANDNVVANLTASQVAMGYEIYVEGIADYINPFVDATGRKLYNYSDITVELSIGKERNDVKVYRDGMIPSTTWATYN